MYSYNILPAGIAFISTIKNSLNVIGVNFFVVNNCYKSHALKEYFVYLFLKVCFIVVVSIN